MEMKVRPVKADLQDGVKIGRESAARASGESRESKRGHSKLRAENRVSLRGPAYQVDNASALPSPRFEMLSFMFSVRYS